MSYESESSAAFWLNQDNEPSPSPSPLDLLSALASAGSISAHAELCSLISGVTGRKNPGTAASRENKTSSL